MFRMRINQLGLTRQGHNSDQSEATRVCTSHVCIYEVGREQGFPWKRILVDLKQVCTLKEDVYRDQDIIIWLDLWPHSMAIKLS